MKTDIINKVKDKNKLLYIVVNPDGLSSKKFYRLYKFVVSNRRVGWIYDESTAIKNEDTDRARFAREMGNSGVFKRIMTGTPITETPLDVFSQTEFLQEGLLGFKSYYSMKTRYCEMRRRKFGMRSFDEVVGYRDLDDLYKRLSKFSSFLKLTDCTDMPEQVFRDVAVEMTPEQAAHYASMRKFAIAWFENNEVTAVNALAMFRKLHQIAVGQMKISETEYVSIPNNRLEVLSDLMEEANHKVLIWSVYKNSTLDILKHLGKKAVGLSVKLNPEERFNLIERWKTSDVQGLVLSQASAAHGLNLIEALTSIFYSNDFSVERRIQALRRNWRLGQTQRTNVIDLFAPGTIEVGIVPRLLVKMNIADVVITKKGFIDMIDGILPAK
jgi:SNF2 family DNA or RNA helicase